MSFRSNAESSCKAIAMTIHNPPNSNAVSISLSSQCLSQTSFRRNAESSCKAIAMTIHNPPTTKQYLVALASSTRLKRHSAAMRNPVARTIAMTIHNCPHSNAVPSSLGFQPPSQTSFRSNAESSCKDDSDDNTQSPPQ